jgi:cell wall-associated NlpC family hydrolase
MTLRDQFLAAVRSYVGTPYRHQGRQPGLWLDCPGPLICAAWETGIKPRSWDVTGYARTPDGTVLQGLCEEHMQAITLAEAEPGDAVLVRFQQGRPQHLGILIDATPSRRWWIEAEGERYKRVLESRLMFDRRTILVGAYRVPGL